MKSRLDAALDLLHGAGEASLATLSVAAAGHPFASYVPFALDAGHQPILLLSGLAEHSRNLAADARASLLVAKNLGEGEIARVTLMGMLAPCPPDAALRARYLRYHPAAERFLQLGDFSFYRFTSQRIYVVGGFAQAGWLEGSRLTALPRLSAAEEDALIERCRSGLPAGMRLLGIDACGVDLARGGARLRFSFAQETDGAKLERNIRALLADIAA